LRATNTFDKPGEVKPASLSVTASGGAATLVIPPRSIVAVQLRTS
jgi:hypothetical protein